MSAQRFGSRPTASPRLTTRSSGSAILTRSAPPGSDSQSSWLNSSPWNNSNGDSHAPTGAATLAADSACFALKDLVERTRPFVAHPEIDPLYVVHSSSFPAGHAATAVAGATLLSYIAPKGAFAFVLLAAAIGYSRVYVGVHYPGDVLAGALVGAVVGCIAIGIWCWLRGSNTRLGQALTEI
jgi:PAP2 superfamily